MPLKPIDKRNPLETRDAIWAAIRRRKIFSTGDLYQATRCSRDTIREYTTGLLRAGYLGIHAEANPPAPTILELVKDPGIDAPRVRRNGTEVTQGNPRENMWRTMRIIGEFSPRDLAIHATTEETVVSEVDAKGYIGHLYKAGYLALTAKARGGSQARYRFLKSKFTGPKPPMVQRVSQVYDPNLKKVVWSGIPSTPPLTKGGGERSERGDL